MAARSNATFGGVCCRIIDWAALARSGQPIVIYMGLKNLPEIAGALIDGGLSPSTPVAVIMAATYAIANTLADMAYVLLDKRVRYD